MLFDSQIFKLQKYGGISLYFSKIIQQFIANPELGIQPIMNFKYTNNQHLSEVAPELSYSSRIEKMPYSNKYFNLSTKELTGEDFDLIHFTYYLPSKYLFFSSIPRVSTIHDFTPEILFSNYFFKKRMHYFKRSYLKNSEGIIFVSNHTLMSFEKIYPSLSLNSSRIIYHGVDNRPTSISFNPSLSDKFFLYIGNRSYYKNFNFLLESFSKLSNNSNINLYCWGGGAPSKSELNLIHSLKISEQIKFFSDINIDLPTLLSSAIALVNPSTEEGFGFTNLEAFSYGCPVICSDISIFHEILGDLATYFDPNSNASLTSRLQDFIVANRSIDRNVLISHADSFSWTKCAEDTSNFYHKVFSKCQK